jgi:hypothetical protein
LIAGTQSGRAQQWFDQGIRLSFAFNHAEAQRAFREAQKIDPPARSAIGARRWCSVPTSTCR